MDNNSATLDEVTVGYQLLPRNDIGTKRRSEVMDAMMFLAAMEEGAEERAQQLEEKRAK